VELHFVDQPCLEVLLSDVRATAQADVLIAGSFPGLLEGGSDSVGDEREAGASLLGNRLAGVVGDDEDRHVERRIVPSPAVPRVISPWALAAEHVPAHHGRSKVLERFLDDPGRSVYFATLLAVRLTPGRKSEDPLVEPYAPRPSGFSSLWFGPAMKPSNEIEMP